MTRLLRTALVLILLTPMAAVAADPKSQEVEEKALESADAWLELVDDGKYGDSWDSAAAYFKTAVSKDDFVKSLTAARKPLGNVKTRRLKSKQYRTSLPGAPDGQYVVIQYETSFANKEAGIETITPMLDKDSQWRVSGYYIK